MIKKLSLAALVAMGSMSFASATPLIDAIKNVNLNGYMRIRFYNDKVKNNSAANATDTQYNRWRTNAKLVFTLPIDETLSLTYRVHAQTDVREKATKNTSNAKTGLTDSLFFLKYHKDAVTAMGGVIPLAAASIVSADSFTTGNGPAVLGLYNVGNGLTVGAAYIDELFNANDSAIGGTLSNDIYALAALYNNKDYGSLNLWAYKVTDLFKYIFTAQAGVKIPGVDGVKLNLAYGSSKLEDNAVLNGTTLFTGSAPSAHNFYQAEVAANVDTISGKIGYAHTNKNDGLIVTSDDASFGQIPMALRYNLANLTDINAWYAKAKANVASNTDVWASYARIDQSKEAGNNDSNEFDVGANYKYNKKLNFAGYYAYLNYGSDAEANGNNDNGELRLEAKYSF